MIIDNSCGYRAIHVGFRFSTEFVGVPNYSGSTGWRKLVGRGYDDVFQMNGMRDFLCRVNIFTHKTRCGDICTTVDCPYTNRFDESIPFGALGMIDFEDMNAYLESAHHYLVIIDTGDLNHPIYPGRPAEDNDKPIYIEWQRNEKHFNFIKDMIPYLDKQFYCPSCFKGHATLSHKCDYNCHVCSRIPKCSGGQPIQCEACSVTFVNQRCYDNHLDNNFRLSGPRCKDRIKCDKCGVHYANRKDNKHVCGEYKCHDCGKKYKDLPHYCMLKPLDIEKLTKEDGVNKIIVTFDIESCTVPDGSGKDIHKPNLLISGMDLILVGLLI